MSSSLQQHISILSFIITIVYSHHAVLTPITKRINRTSVITNINDVNLYGDQWLVNTQSEDQWQFIVLIDPSYGFHDKFSSSIIFTVNSNQAEFFPGDELIFGVTASNAEYISFKIPLSVEQPNQIYPLCNPSKTSTQLFATGDISSIPQTDRDCDVAGGSCANWGRMIPPNGAFAPSSPITFEFENHPETDTLSVYFHTHSFASGFQQICHFGNSFLTNHGLKIYISGSNPLHTYTISSFDIQSHVQYPTQEPTLQPSNSPTKYPIVTPTNQPTNSPSNNPSINPTIQPSNSPTKNPTQIPTNPPSNSPSNNPSINPSKYPTISPTYNPSIYPTYNPSKYPTKYPTTTPTNEPSHSPTKNPTTTPTTTPTNEPSNSPTKNPTVNPTQTPSNQPSNSPTQNPSSSPSIEPTFEPTINPTATPTVHPTIQSEYPTYSPTNNPIPEGYKLGAYDQLCEWSYPNKLCNENSDILAETGGRILCLQPYDCCMCKTIQCGFDNTFCNSFYVGNNGVYGVQDIRLAGNPNGINGVDILCEYYQSCKDAAIDASDVSYIKCDGRESCQNTLIAITNPKPNFVLECTGFAACQGLEIYIDLLVPSGGCDTSPIGRAVRRIFDLSKIKCSNQDACNGMKITVNNEGCDYARIVDLECIEPNSCNEAVFNFIGDVFIENCQCGPSCDTAIGLEQCFENLEKYQCSDPFECQGEIKTIVNPAEYFEFICSDVQSCEKSRFTIGLKGNSRREVKYMKGLFMSGLYAGRNATFNFENDQGVDLHVDKLECGGLGSCNGFTLITGGNVFIDNVICGSNACNGCEIKETVFSPAIPCDPSLVVGIV